MASGRLSATRSAGSATRVQAQERLRAGEVWQEHGLVFATVIGRPLEGGYVNELFKPEGWTRPTNGWYSPR